MCDLAELYHELILDHGKRPRNLRAIEHPDRHAEGFNPLCGDRVRVYVALHDGVIEDMSFTGVGCAICMASASIMTEELRGKPLTAAMSIFDWFRARVTGEAANGESAGRERLRALFGVSRFPMRVKCATLPWHTMLAAIDQREQTVSTE